VASSPPRLPRLGHRFRDEALLDQALTHRSAGRANNERLEFLGDAVLSAVVSELLYEVFPRASEGELTRLRAELVREASLAALAREIGLGDALQLGPGELKSGGYRRDSILADAFEAVFGAIYLDAGFGAARDALRALLVRRVEALTVGGANKDPKTRLQELLQGQGLPLPVYELVATRGDEHNKTFQTRCTVAPLGLSAEGAGPSRRASETAAADALLALMAESAAPTGEERR
jgi:ribonuclease-3